MPKPAPRPRRKLSREGLLLIKSFEGFRPRAVARRDGTLIIGYGHTQSAREGIDITEEEAELLLMHDLIPAANLIHAHVRRPLSQNQYDALISFIYSIGPERFEKSGILVLLRRGQMEAVAEAIASVPERQQPPIDMPYRRRSAERALFEMADNPTLEKLLTAPVTRPDAYVAPPQEAPLGTTGVLRHEALNMPRAWSTPCRRRKKSSRDMGSLVLMGAVAVIVGLAAYMAYQGGISMSVPQSYGLIVGSALIALSMILIGTAVWLYGQGTRRPRRPIRPTR